jgi:hypothetical protein
MVSLIWVIRFEDIFGASHYCELSLLSGDRIPVGRLTQGKVRFGAENEPALAGGAASPSVHYRRGEW